jgi:hypothetical protein
MWPQTSRVGIAEAVSVPPRPPWSPADAPVLISAWPPYKSGLSELAGEAMFFHFPKAENGEGEW